MGWAVLAALILQLTGLLVIGDKLLRIPHYRLASFPVSGEIVFVGASYDLAAPDFPHRRAQLASLVSALDQAGARRIFVNLSFKEPSDPAADAALNQALRQAGGRAFLVDELITGIDGAEALSSQVPQVGAGVKRVGSYAWADFFGFVWYMQSTVEAQGRRLPSLPAALAGIEGSGGQTFPVSYFLDLGTLPVHRYEDLLRQPAQVKALAGKSIVIGPNKSAESARLNLPGVTDVSTSLIHILAAETLIAKQSREITGLASLAFGVLLLLLAALVPGGRLRLAAYGLVVLAVPLAFLVTAQMGVRLAGASVLAMLLIFGGFRARELWKANLRLVDQDTNLPTFAALEIHQATAETAPAIVVAKIHRFEEVRRTLPRALHREYLLRIISRLKAANPGAAIYIGPANQLAWTMPDKDPDRIRDHLEGLRALFASPLLVGDNPVDVGITFGIDLTPGPQVARRLASAVSATERTNETYDPIAIADSTCEDDLIWNISLQARIDAALASGEIFLAFQPKIALATGELAGVEALVRWLDPVRGFISPDYFIRQCEDVGRMGHLTRHVLTRGCEAGLGFLERGLRVPVAINISATQLHERAIVRTLREVLAETGFDPRLLTLEVTETYRFSNLERAAEILGELKGLGVSISMDDFGVGAASLEALMMLPFAEIKIDRRFIAAIEHDAKAAAIVRHVLRLGQELAVNVVAEGVENQQTLKLLRDSACPMAQGYGIARPGSFDDVLNFQLNKGNPRSQQG